MILEMVNENNFISINEVLADVTVMVGDPEERLLSHGFYVAQVRNAIDELGFDTVFLEGYEDIEIPATHNISLPQNAYRIKRMHIYKGDPITVTHMENVYWKKGGLSMGKDQGFTANMYPGSSDPYFGNGLYAQSEAIYWFVYHKGVITLSDGCDGFDYLRVVFDGIPSGVLDEAKMVPPEVRNALVLWAVEKCASALKTKDIKLYRTIQIDAAAQLDLHGFNGVWQQAKRRLKYMGKKSMSDVAEYNNRPRA
jgi:hypothetical protein